MRVPSGLGELCPGFRLANPYRINMDKAVWNVPSNSVKFYALLRSLDPKLYTDTHTNKYITIIFIQMGQRTFELKS